VAIEEQIFTEAPAKKPTKAKKKTEVKDE